MTRRINLDQWHDRTEEPAIVWAYVGTWDLQPVAVDDTHDSDTYNELTRAWYAAGYYYTLEELEQEHADSLTHDQIEELYSRGDGSAEAAGLPTEFYAEGVNDDGSDAIIYVDEATIYETRRATLEEATPYMYAEDLEEIRELIAAARKEYDC